MDPYASEDEQVEAIKKWWAENGRSVVLGLVLGLGAIFGWRGWEGHVAAQAEAASALYEQMVVAARTGSKEASGYAGQIIESHPSTAYATFARMLLAQQAVISRELEEAEEHLRAALDGDVNAAMAHEIRLRLARVLIAREKYSDALALLERKDTGDYAAGYEELRGDALALQGDRAGARAAYEQALVRLQSSGRSTEILESKLDDLGRAGQS